MPTISSAMIPSPKSWDEFEEITLSCLKIKWSNPNLTRNGRQGQSQDGVDIYGEDNVGFNCGIQCKLVQAALTVDAIKNEIKKAEKFQPPLEIFYIATNTPTDAALQKEIRKLSDKRRKSNKFGLGIFFWNDLIQELIKDEKEFQKHYPQFLIKNSIEVPSNGNRNVCLLDLGYFGTNIDETMYWLFGDHLFWDENNSMEFWNLVHDLNTCIRVLYTQEEATSLLNKLKELLDYVYPYITGSEKRDEGWKPAREIAITLENEFKRLEYSLSSPEIIVFKLGNFLGAWNNHEPNAENPLSNEQEDLILKIINKLDFDDKSIEQIKSLLEKYRNDDSISIIHIPHKIFNVVRRNLLLGF